MWVGPATHDACACVKNKKNARGQERHAGRERGNGSLLGGISGRSTHDDRGTAGRGRGASALDAGLGELHGVGFKG